MSTLTIIAIVISALFIIIDLAEGHFGWVIIWAFILTFNIITGINQVKENKEKTKLDDGVTEAYIVKDVKSFYTDSTITINGTDTTKTYTITYLK